MLGLVRRTRRSFLTAGLSDNEEEFELEDTNMELTEVTSENLLIPDNISVIPDSTFIGHHIYDSLSSNLESFIMLESTSATPVLFISPTEEEFNQILGQNSTAATIASHINEASIPSTSTNATQNKRGRRPLSEEVKLQRTEDKVQEKIAKKIAKKHKKNNSHLINYLIKVILKYLFFIFKII